MKKIFLSLLVGTCLASQTAVAQSSTAKCAQELILNKMAEQSPARAEQVANYRKELTQPFEFDAHQNTANKTNAPVIIPVIFHFVLTQSQLNRIGGPAGVQQRVDSQIVVLQRDFNAANSDLSNLPAAFNSVKGNPEIIFMAAHTTPANTSTPGYEIKVITGSGADTVFDILNGSAGSGFACSDAKYSSNKGLSSWDNTRYLNIWVCNITNSGSDNILGVAISPGFAAGNGIPTFEKGVVVDYGAFGKRRLLSDFYISGITGGRTLVHELGHYFELAHIWGTTPGCGSDDDGIADTHQQDDANYGCQSWFTVFTSCQNEPGGEMWMNFMDYSSDACMIFFTAGQSAKAKAQFDNNTKPSCALTQNTHLVQWPAAIAPNSRTIHASVIPNPSTGDYVFSYDASQNKLNAVMITNLMGQKIWEQNVTDVSGRIHINLEHQPDGLYLLHSTFESGTFTQKLIKE